MHWKRLIRAMQVGSHSWLHEWIGDLSLLVDTTQLNRRTRIAWQQGRNTRACFLMADHQRRRISRRREIRREIFS